ncbi:MAG: class I SAM-dependent methyltransferase [Candidatus Aminicenantes bacterium]|nr:MAG: class I SAM-dependent methyltransferase [Candidatus Aminicenantes bacterium]
MKIKKLEFLFILLLLLSFIVISSPYNRKIHAGIIIDQERAFQIEAWEKGLNERQPPIKIMDAIGLKPGMIIGEVGAGTGRMTMWLADRVGESGKVYANDIDRSALDHLRRRCKRDGFKNVEIIVGTMENPGFHTDSLDIAFMINVYHHLADPVPILQNLRPSLKPDGRLAIVECDPDKVEWGDEHGCSRKEDVTEVLKKAGFEVVRIETFLDEDSLYIAKPINSF